MKKNCKRKTSFKSSVIVLLLMAVLLMASSYAWFTSNQVVTISSLDVSVQARNGLQISVDGTNWKAVLQNQDIIDASKTYTAAVNQIPTELEPVSTAGDVDAATGFMNMFYGSVEADGNDFKLSATKDTETNATSGKFIAFDIFLRVDTDTQVYLSRNSNVSYTGTADRGLQNAARVAFVEQGNTPVGSDLADIQALKAVDSTGVHIWEPNYDVHTAAAVSHAYDTYGLTISTADEAVVPYDGIKAVIAKENGVLLADANATDNPLSFATVTTEYRTPAAFASADTNQQIFNLAAGITKIRIYMWIEGQDVDCENNASGADIAYNIQITTLDA